MNEAVQLIDVNESKQPGSPTNVVGPIDVSAFAALGSAPRAGLLVAMLEGPKRPSELVGYIEKAMSLWYHLQPLLEEGFIVAQTVEPKRTLYHLNPDKLRALALDLNAAANMAPPLPEVLQAKLREPAPEPVLDLTSGPEQASAR